MNTSLRVAVVGHANTGKTSLLQTLLRRRDFGTVSPRGGTTRVNEVGEILDDLGVIARVVDTPGLEESARLRDAIEGARIERHEDPRTLLDRFLESDDAGPECELALEAEALRATTEASVLLYVIDAREEPRPRHLDELHALVATARPVVPILNFVARPEADAARWREACARQGLHATVAFDAVVYDDAGERRLLDAVRTLSPEHAEAIDRWIELRRRERLDAVAAASAAAADLLVDAAAAVRVTDPTPRDEAAKTAAFRAATAALLDDLRTREIEARDRIAACFGFAGEEAETANLEITEALGGVDFASPASLERAGMWAAGGGAGLVAAGAMIDLATGGISMGGFTALGAAGAAIGAVGASGGKMLRRLRGQDEVRLGDSGIDVLLIRARATILAFLARGHAAIEPVSLEIVIEEGLRRDGDPGDGGSRSNWTELRRRARGTASWSTLSHPPSNRAPAAARAEVALRIEEWLRKAILPDP
ncbi:MAG: hypothetical protein CMJ52_01660 [Planctomycetaceae bacterium]|nr:hypothetical protein [Planctomycetaceae bacterium]